MNFRPVLLANHLRSLNSFHISFINNCSFKKYSSFHKCIRYKDIDFNSNLLISNKCQWKRSKSTVVTETYDSNESSFNDSIFYKLSESQPVSYVQKLLLTVHDTSGLPWWATIAITTLILRSAISFPLGIYQAYISAKVENISSIDMPEIAKDVKDRIRRQAKELNWSEKEASYNYRNELKFEWDKLIISQNCHPVKATLPIWFQIPTWVCFSTALRNLAYMLPLKDADAQIRFLELSVGGFLWMPNLVVPDKTFILPILLGLSNLVIIEIQCMMRMRESTKGQRFATNFFRGVSIILVPISSTVPLCVCLYWTVSSLLGLCQNLVLMSNRVRSTFGIPDTPSTLEHPYAHLTKEIALKLGLSR